MGMDLEKTVSIDCCCGKGTFEVEKWVPDHPYPTNSYTTKEYVNCPNCSANYQIIEQNGDFCVVTMADVAIRQGLLSQVATTAAALQSSNEACDLVQSVQELLDKCTSVAAKYRLLHGIGMVVETEGTFRRHWQNSINWVQAHNRPYNYRKFATLVGAISPAMDQDISNYETLYMQARMPLNTIAVLPKL